MGKNFSLRDAIPASVYLSAKLSLLLLVLSASIFKVRAQNFDIDLLRKIHTERNTKWDNTFCTLSNSATYFHAGVPMIYYGVGLIQKDSVCKRQAVQMGIGMVINAGFTYALKRGVNRNRPGLTYPQYISPLEPRYLYSFPSGHTSTVFNTATAISLHTKKWYYIAPAFAYASAVGYSRMHLGVHYPTDVFAGALLGSASALVSNKATKWLQQRRWAKKTYKLLVL
jgi:membrane-associated phospholipid phosphatase